MKTINRIQTVAGIAGLFIGAAFLLLTSLQYFLLKVTGLMADKPIGNQLWYGIVLRLHIIGGLVAIFTGPFQFMPRFRNRRLRLHKNLGYAYISGVIISGLAGAVVIPHAMGGIISQTGLLTLSACWLFSLERAVRTILKKDFKGHRRWMFINYALTFGAFTQRLFLGFALLTGIDFLVMYRIANWAAWIPNVLIAILLVRRLERRERGETMFITVPPQ